GEVEVSEDSLSAPFESHIANRETFGTGEAAQEPSEASSETASEGAGTETDPSQSSTEPDNG
ncbi:MAG: hypothetical protein ILA12_04805, partial [Butyrivibrio sp.]|nr:hypothetical protein [Butyrivibrio sp.]